MQSRGELERPWGVFAVPTQQTPVDPEGLYLGRSARGSELCRGGSPLACEMVSVYLVALTEHG